MYYILPQCGARRKNISRQAGKLKLFGSLPNWKFFPKIATMEVWDGFGPWHTRPKINITKSSSIFSKGNFGTFSLSVKSLSCNQCSKKVGEEAGPGSIFPSFFKAIDRMSMRFNHLDHPLLLGLRTLDLILLISWAGFNYGNKLKIINFTLAIFDEFFHAWQLSDFELLRRIEWAMLPCNSFHCRCTWIAP